MTSWIITAVPAKSSSVWKISTEKVPHLTLLYFGEQSSDDYSGLLSKIDSVVKPLQLNIPFWLPVQHRGTLGVDNADVLFFDDKYVSELNNLRNSLLQVPELKTAYESVDQFPSWIPHLTLGYPESPANNGQTYVVQFDSIEFWTEEYRGFKIL